MPDRKFPNLFIIGAMKSGTSSLHEYLHQHPEIYMSRFKEPQYFAPHTTRRGVAWGQGNPYPEPGIDWYLRLFDDAGNVTYAGESSVSYTVAPSKNGCPQRIYDFNPDAKLIYLMRDPIERTISHYWHAVVDGREDRDMLDALRSRQQYIDISNYAMQLQPYLEGFGRNQVFALTTEELNSNPQAVFRQLFRWLGVDSDVSIETHVKHNVSAKVVRQTRRGAVCIDTLLKHRRWWPIVSRFPQPAIQFVERLTYRRVSRLDVDVEPVRRFLRPIMESHVQKLSQLLDREFDEWTIVPKRRLPADVRAIH